MKEQIKKYQAPHFSIKTQKDAQLIKNCFWGDVGNCMLASLESADKIIIGLPGLAALKPCFTALKNKKEVALATKEVLVSAGSLILQEARKHQTQILPIDSEHSAIFRCLEGRKMEEIKKVILTCSGGPFLGFSVEELKNVKALKALKHPNWKMGKKISIDSSTLMNKGFEVIEAMWLFGLPLSKIEVVIHPQSIIHSAVEFVDGSIIAQMAARDMRIPIQYALLYPNPIGVSPFKKISLTDLPLLSFQKPDLNTFRCLNLAYMAICEGNSAMAILTAANDIVVEAYLENKITFLQIPDILEEVLSFQSPSEIQSLEDVLEVDAWSRRQTEFLIKRVTP